MVTRTSHKWSRCADTLNLQHINFNGDYPEIGNLYELPELNVANCHDYKNINSQSLVSTFVDDYILGRFWNNPAKYGRMYRALGAEYVMSPDFSLLVGMPEPLLAYQVYKNRLVGHVWQQQGLNVIPTVSWSDKKSFEYSIKGITFGSIIAVSNIGCRNEAQKKYFDMGFNYVTKYLEPEKIIFMCNKKYRKAYESEKVQFIDSHFDKKRKSWVDEAVKV